MGPLDYSSMSSEWFTKIQIPVSLSTCKAVEIDWLTSGGQMVKNIISC